MEIPVISISTLETLLEQSNRGKDLKYETELVTYMTERQPHIVEFAKLVAEAAIEGLEEDEDVSQVTSDTLKCYIVYNILLPFKGLYNQIECNELIENA